jgi:hypothetical protein
MTLPDTTATQDQTKPEQLLVGAIDMHVHAGPHLTSSPRRVDPFEAARQARDAGMRAIVLIDVFLNSSGVAWLVNRHVPGIDVLGGISLNTCYGGMNPRAVKTALQYGNGAAFVSMGTHSTHFLASHEGRVVDGKPVPFGDLYPDFRAQELSRAIQIPLEDPVGHELDQVLRLIADDPQVFLMTGHVSGAETIRLVELAQRYGIEKVLVSSLAVDQLSPDQQVAVAKQGAYLERSLAHWAGFGGIPHTHYYVEHEYLNQIPVPLPYMPVDLGQMCEQIRTIGPEHFVLDTDYGMQLMPTPVEGMRQFVVSLLETGFSAGEIRTMISVNPARLLGLDEGE